MAKNKRKFSPKKRKKFFFDRFKKYPTPPRQFSKSLERLRYRRTHSLLHTVHFRTTNVKRVAKRVFATRFAYFLTPSGVRRNRIFTYVVPKRQTGRTLLWRKPRTILSTRFLCTPAGRHFARKTFKRCAIKKLLKFSFCPPKSTKRAVHSARKVINFGQITAQQARRGAGRTLTLQTQTRKAALKLRRWFSKRKPRFSRRSDHLTALSSKYRGRPVRHFKRWRRQFSKRALRENKSRLRRQRWSFGSALYGSAWLRHSFVPRLPAKLPYRNFRSRSYLEKLTRGFRGVRKKRRALLRSRTMRAVSLWAKCRRVLLKKTVLSVYLSAKQRGLFALRYVAKRSNGRRVRVRRFKHWFLKKLGFRLPKLRRRGTGRLFAGVFKRPRWRRGRKDRLVFKRQLVRFPRKREIVTRTTARLTALRRATARRYYSLPRPSNFTRVVSAPFGGLRKICRIRQVIHSKIYSIRRPFITASGKRTVNAYRIVAPSCLKRGKLLSSRSQPLGAAMTSIRGAHALRRRQISHASRAAYYLSRRKQSKHKRGRSYFSTPQRAAWLAWAGLRRLTTQRALRTTARAGRSYAGSAQLQIHSKPERGRKLLQAISTTAVAANIKTKTITTSRRPEQLTTLAVLRRGRFCRSAQRYSRVVRNTLATSRALAVQPKFVISAPRAQLLDIGYFSRLTPTRHRSRVARVRSGFLQRRTILRASTKILPLSPAGVSFQKRRYRELRFYHRRPRMRLPNLTTTRRRRRKGGLVTFVRNSLNRPDSAFGRREQLLPPLAIYQTAQASYEVAPRRTSQTLRASVKRDDALPRFRRRPPTRANLKAINRVRRKRYAKLKHALFLRTRWAARVRRVNFYGRPDSLIPAPFLRPMSNSRTRHFLRSRVGALNTLATALAAAEAAVPVSTTRSAVVASGPNITREAKIKKRRDLDVRKTVSLLRRSVRTETPRLARTLAVTNLARQAATAAQRKVAGLWHLRSTKGMLASERSLSAWTPQMSVRSRRRHFPRLEGSPLPRRWLSSREKRERRMENARLLAQNIPQRRYIDYGPAKLQYYFGSAVGSGYSRFRRVHRAHSKHSRWWRPNAVAVPFPHPFSRRALNSVHHQRLDLTYSRTPRSHTIASLLRQQQGTALHSKFPPRLIPWRNFRYQKPRFKPAPSVLQRWTFVPRKGKTRRSTPRVTRSVIRRSARQLRKLERYTPSRNILRGRRWIRLDSTPNLIGITETQFISAAQTVPVQIWQALRSQAGSPSAYALLQQNIVEQFRQWVRKQATVYTKAPATTSTSATAMLLTIIAGKLQTGSQNVPAVTHAGQWHATYRARAFDKKANLKANRSLSSGLLSKNGLPAASILAREQSSLYRRWLRGFETTFKKTQTAHTPTSRSRYAPNVALAFGRYRLRFPASGRRRRSYDSLLHAFVKKTAPSRLRRTSPLRVKRATPRLAVDYRENLITSSLFGALSRRRRLARKLSHVAYLASSWRELANFRKSMNNSKAAACAPAGKGKQRFLSLPTAVVSVERAFQVARKAHANKRQLRAIRTGILRRALRRRRRERVFVDLRRSALQRRLPKDAATRPRRLYFLLRRRQAVKFGPYSRILRRFKRKGGQWSLVHLSAVGRRHDSLTRVPLPQSLLSGENTTPAKRRIRKEKRAFRNFVLPITAPKRQRLRRQNRDSCKRKRGSRRRKRARRSSVLRNTKHWSEKRDRRLRGTRFLHKRTVLARKVSRSLVKRLVLTRGWTKFWLQSKRRVITRLSKFSAQAHASILATHAGGMEKKLTSRDLMAKSSLHRRRRVRKFVWRKQPSKGIVKLLRNKREKISHWRIGANRKSRFAQRKYISQGTSSKRSRIRRVRGVRRAFRATRNLTVGAKLVALSSTRELLSPLYFQKPAVRAVKSAVAKEQEALYEIDVKEERYKITAQYVESLTTFIPEFINHMLSKKVKKDNNQTTVIEAQRAIKNIYWSLRVYLNVDPLDTRFLVRDKRPAARLRIFEALSSLSAAQRTEQPERAVLRYRFQPSKILVAPNTMRFRNDWLRTFFPAKHALYQESAEDYGMFLLSTHRIRRLRVGPKGIASWRTAAPAANMEARARQLLALRSSRRRRRFETVLQTTRRAFAHECAPIVRNTSGRCPFFQRNFSTYTSRSPMLVAKWAQKVKRFATTPFGWRSVSPFVLSSARNRVIARLEARGKAGYIATDRLSISNSFLDSRTVRVKSARSRQYLLRAHTSLGNLASAKVSANVAFYARQVRRRFARTAHKAFLGRVQRRSISNSGAFSKTNLPRPWAIYKTARAQTMRLTREVARVPASHRTSSRRTCQVTYRRAPLLPRTAVSTHRRFSPLRKRYRTIIARKVKKAVWVRRPTKNTQMQAWGTKLQHLDKKADAQVRSNRRIIKCVLQYRYSSTQALLGAVAPKYGRLCRRLRKTQLRVRRVTRKLASAVSAKKALLSSVVTSVLTQRKRKIIRTKNPWAHHQPLLYTAMRKIVLPNKLITGRRVFVPGVKRTRGAYFINQARRQAIRNFTFTRVAAFFTRYRRAVPFEMHRSRLWNKLTLRWMKKHRLGRYWLRDTAHWLRDPWLSRIVAPDASLRPDRFGGELRSRPQQVGEYVANVDESGRDIKRKNAPRERHKFQKIIPKAGDDQFRKTNKILKRGSLEERIVAKHRLRISRQARRKPVPTMRLANYEFRDAIREHKENKAKSAKEKAEAEAMRVKTYWARKARKLPPIRERRLPLKYPANLWLPRSIWKDIQRRVRKFEWRESDEVFFRKGFRKAFQFYPNERRQAPWLEHLLYTRATFSTRLREFRRRQFPHEQKKFKWLQRVRKALYPGRKRRYFKWRRWPRLRQYNQRLHRSLFKLRDGRAARRHFKQLAHTSRPAVSAFVSLSRGLTNRLDIVCLQLGFAPTAYWARIVVAFGLLRINGVTVYAPDHTLQPGDVLYPNWDTIARFQHYFKPYLRRRENYQRRNRESTSFYPTNLEYHPGTRVFVYKHASDESDLRASDRIRAVYLRWFKLDSCK